MRPFTGFEPLVGEIVGLRTFRVDESGLLLPLYAAQPWYDGPNTAVCTPPTGERRGNDHDTVSPECECGFYAYGTEAAAGLNRQMRFVQAVVSCWGRVVAGTHGVRAEHARIDAIWLGDAVPRDVRARIAQTYPSARLYTDRDRLLREHPLSVLPSYRPPVRPRRLRRVGQVAAGAGLLSLGVLPSSWLTGPIWYLWIGVLAAVGLGTAWVLLASRTTGHLALALVLASVLAWLAAPGVGPAGWLLRLPVLRGLLVAGGGYLMSLRRGYFPVVRTRRARRYSGVRQ